MSTARVARSRVKSVAVRSEPVADQYLPAGDRASRIALTLSAHIPAMLANIASTISASASALYRPKFEVGITEWRILAQLAAEPWISAAEICQSTGLDKGAVSRGLGYLEKIGLIEMIADPSDQRRQFIALTRAGLTRHDGIVRLANLRERQLLAGFSAAERKMLLDFLERLRLNSHHILGAKPTKPAK